MLGPQRHTHTREGPAPTAAQDSMQRHNKNCWRVWKTSVLAASRSSSSRFDTVAYHSRDNLPVRQRRQQRVLASWKFPRQQQQCAFSPLPKEVCGGFACWRFLLPIQRTCTFDPKRFLFLIVKTNRYKIGKNEGDGTRHMPTAIGNNHSWQEPVSTNRHQAE